jgi:hypothetical protein
VPPNNVLVDTSIWILALRKNPDKAAKSRLDTLLSEDRVAVSPPIKLELLGGTKTEAEYEKLSQRLDALESLPVDEAIWNKAAKLAFSLRRKGVTVPYINLAIACVAMNNDAVLLHADSDFDLIAQHSKLKVESFA